jgi:hypothetical protein
MYEALTLSLHIKGAPKAQVLRAALSAADFCENPIDLLNVGFVMRTVLDLKQHAFPLYRQVLETMPPKRDLYAATLRLAEELFRDYDDEESLRWIGLAVLSQEWDGALGNKLTQDADDVLMMLGNRMMKQERNDEAQQLASDIREAKLRDCVVTIEWTGEAGIDLMVREPSNSLCWFRNPRSMSGGLLKTTPVMLPAKISSQSAVKRVSYVCPRGFNGLYSLILQKSWGNLSNNLVKVIVETNVVPGESKTEGVTVPMHPEGIVIDFALESGRRTESASEAELAAADMQMTAAQRTVDRNTALWRLQDDGVLGQATDANTDANTAAAAAAAGGSTSGPTGIPGTAGRPGPTGTPAATTGGTTVIADANLTDYLYGARYIGYMPVVESISYGVYWYVYPGEIAVTPDRRYVLMLFSNGSLEFTRDPIGGETREYNLTSGSTDRTPTGSSLSGTTNSGQASSGSSSSSRSSTSRSSTSSNRSSSSTRGR